MRKAFLFCFGANDGDWSPLATPKINDCKHSLHRNISLQPADLRVSPTTSWFQSHEIIPIKKTVTRTDFFIGANDGD